MLATAHTHTTDEFELHDSKWSELAHSVFSLVMLPSTLQMVGASAVTKITFRTVLSPNCLFALTAAAVVVAVSPPPSPVISFNQ